MDLPRRLDRVAIDSLKTAAIDREQGREKVTMVAQELDNRVRDCDIVRARIDAAREVVDINVGQDHAFASGVGVTTRIGGHPAATDSFFRRSETLVLLKFFFSFLAARCASTMVFFYSSEVILQSFTKCFWLQSEFRQSGSLSFSTLPEVELADGRPDLRLISSSLVVVTLLRRLVCTKRVVLLPDLCIISQEVSKTEEVLLSVVLLQPMCVFIT